MEWNCVGSDPGPAAYKLCDLIEVTYIVCFSFPYLLHGLRVAICKTLAEPDA